MLFVQPNVLVAVTAKTCPTLPIPLVSAVGTDDDDASPACTAPDVIKLEELLVPPEVLSTVVFGCFVANPEYTAPDVIRFEEPLVPPEVLSTVVFGCFAASPENTAPEVIRLVELLTGELSTVGNTAAVV